MEFSRIPGLNFSPTGSELLFYLKQRVLDFFHFGDPNSSTNSHLIPDVELHNWDPAELPGLYSGKCSAKSRVPSVYINNFIEKVYIQPPFLRFAFPLALGLCRAIDRQVQRKAVVLFLSPEREVPQQPPWREDRFQCRLLEGHRYGQESEMRGQLRRNR